MDPLLVVARPDVTWPIGSRPITPAGVHGEQYVGRIHPPLYEQAKAGNLYWGSTLVGGTIIPVNAASLVSTFTLWNPLGSGKNLVLQLYTVGLFNSATAVIGGLGLVYQAGVGSGVVIPSSQTALTPVNGLVGSGNNTVAKLLSAGTCTGTPTFLMSLGMSWGTTTSAPGIFKGQFDFNGGLIIPPGVQVMTTSNAAQTAVMGQTFCWTEEPI